MVSPVLVASGDTVAKWHEMDCSCTTLRMRIHASMLARAHCVCPVACVLTVVCWIACAAANVRLSACLCRLQRVPLDFRRREPDGPCPRALCR